MTKRAAGESEDRRHTDPLVRAVLLGATGIPILSVRETELIRVVEQGDGGGETLLGLNVAPDETVEREFELSLGERVRKSAGFYLTPKTLVEHVFDLLGSFNVSPEVVIDPGAGTGRFLIEASSRFPSSRLVGLETLPEAALIARGNLAAHGLSNRSTILVSDFRKFKVPENAGQVLLVGNPPYVRHQLLSAESKEWLKNSSMLVSSRTLLTANLYAHFYVAAALGLRKGDFGALLTPTEWMYNDSGRVIRELLAGRLGALQIEIISDSSSDFADVMTTLSISIFRVGSSDSRKVSFRLGAINTMQVSPVPEISVEAKELASREKWDFQFMQTDSSLQSDSVLLGCMLAVKRGHATGSNKTWVVDSDFSAIPSEFLIPTVSRAREIFSHGDRLDSIDFLRRLVVLPADLEGLDDGDGLAVRAFIEKAKEMRADSTALARQRRVWWSIPTGIPPAALVTYMRRGTPRFCHNAIAAQNLNIAHGLYPLVKITEKQLLALIHFLNSADLTRFGRKYARGLIKFEPRDVMTIPVPRLLIENLGIDSTDLRSGFLNRG